SFSGKSFASNLTITSQNADKPATFNTLSFTSVSNLTVDSVFVDFTPTAPTLDHHAGLSVRNGTNITIQNSTFEGRVSPLDGLLIGRGIAVIGGENIHITDTDVSQFRRGILTSDIDGLKITYHHVHDHPTTTLAGGDVKNALIEGNHLERSEEHTSEL